MFIRALGFFTVGQFAVSKKKKPNLTLFDLTKPKLKFFLTANCPTAKNVRTGFFESIIDEMPMSSLGRMCTCKSCYVIILVEKSAAIINVQC